MTIARVALDVPLDSLFDFRVPEGAGAAAGNLVVVPFGRARKVGVVVEMAETSPIPAGRLRNLEKVVEDVPRLGSAELDLYDFCARYYHRALGEVAGAALPARLRQVSRRAVRMPRPEADARAGPGPAVEPTPAQRDAVERCL